MLIVTPNNLYGGSDAILEEVALELAAQGFQIDVVCLMDLRGIGWKKLPPQIKLHYLKAPNYSLGILKLFFFLRKMAKRKKYDYSFSTNIHINAALGLARKMGVFNVEQLIVRESTPVFNRFRGLVLWFYRLRYWVGYNAVNKVVCQTNDMEEQLVKHVPFLSHKTVVINNPLNTEKIFHQATQAPSLVFTRPYIIAAGRLMKLKRFHLLIEAYAQLQGDKPDLVILGDGDERSNLEELIRVRNLEERVFLPGYRANPFPYFQKAAVAIVCSEVEGFPNTILQMLLLNDKCICTACCDGLTAIPALEVIPVNDTSAIRSALQKFISRNPFSQEELEAKRSYLKELGIHNYVIDLLNPVEATE